MLWTMEKITSLCLTSKSTCIITSGKLICRDLFSTVGGVSKEAYLDLYISPVVTALKLLFLILPLPTASMKVSSMYLCRGSFWTLCGTQGQYLQAEESFLQALYHSELPPVNTQPTWSWFPQAELSSCTFAWVGVRYVEYELGSQLMYQNYVS